MVPNRSILVPRRLQRGFIGFYSAGAMGGWSGPPPIGFPNYAHGETSTFNTQTQPQIITLPAVINNGDRVIIQYCTGNVTVTTPSGWLLIDTTTNTGVRLGFYYRDCNGTEGGTTVSFAMGGNQRSTVIVHRIQAGTFDPAVAPSLTFSTGASGTNPDPPAHSPAWGAQDTLWIAAYGQRSDSAAVVTFPFPDGNLHARPGTTGAGYNNTGSCWAKVNTASLNPGNFTNGVISSNSTWVAATLAIKPV